MTKSIFIKENQRRAEAAENLMLRLEQEIIGSVRHLGKDITKTHEMLEALYGQTPRGIWERLKKWIGGKE